MYTLTLVFNKDKSKVLMCKHKKFNHYNFIGGKLLPNEGELAGSYRELFEETGISKEDVTLQFVRCERIVTYDKIWSMYVTTGVLEKDVVLIPEANPLEWVDVDDTEVFLSAYGDGNCYTFLIQSLRLLDRFRK